MSKSWCEKNKCMKPLDFKAKEEMITARQANGTGAFVLKAREPDVRTVMQKNPDWWGWKDKKFDGNVTEIIYTPITNDATRLSALIAGNVDVINDPAPQTLKLSQTPGVKAGSRGSSSASSSSAWTSTATSSCTATSRARIR